MRRRSAPATKNPAADQLVFQDESGNPLYQTGKLPGGAALWSPRIGANWDAGGTQRRRSEAEWNFTGKPAYVWISNQVGNTDMLTAPNAWTT